jgi:hypothetical protein
MLTIFPILVLVAEYASDIEEERKRRWCKLLLLGVSKSI